MQHGKQLTGVGQNDRSLLFRMRQTEEKQKAKPVLPGTLPGKQDHGCQTMWKCTKSPGALTLCFQKPFKYFPNSVHLKSKYWPDKVHNIKYINGKDIKCIITQ